LINTLERLLVIWYQQNVSMQIVTVPRTYAVLGHEKQKVQTVIFVYLWYEIVRELSHHVCLVNLKLSTKVHNVH
jgi:hypothetical protein